MTPEFPGPSPITVASLVANLMRLKDHMAVWQHYLLLDEVACARRRIHAIALLRIVRRGSKSRRNRKHRGRSRRSKKQIFHDILHFDASEATGSSVAREVCRPHPDHVIFWHLVAT